MSSSADTEVVTTTTDPVPPSAAAMRRRRRSGLVERIHLPLAGALTAFLAFRAGGFFPDTTAVAVLVLAIALLLRVTLAAEPFGGLGRAAAVALVAVAGFAMWTLVSAMWSDAPARAVVEFDRVLLYLLALAFYAAAPRREGSLTALLRWVLLAFTAVAVAGLASRLAPDVFPISGRYLAERLSFPLTYWNANGMLGALAAVLALHHASGSQEPRWVRIGATAALPALVVMLYLTFSRGAIAAGALGAVAYVALAHPRRLVFTLVTAMPAAAVALVAAYGADALATPTYFEPPGPRQGHELALMLAAACAGAGLVRLLMLPLEARLDAVNVSRARRRRLLTGAAAAVALTLAGTAVAIDAPTRLERELERFRAGDFVPQTGDARDRLTQVGNNGRLEIWRVSQEAWADHRWRGTGAGMFELEWERRRENDMRVTDGHSLYLEVLGELGAPGLALLAMALLVPIVLAAGRLGGAERHAYAAFLAAGAALLVHAGVDWDWEMPAVFLWLFAAAGVVVALPTGRARLGAPTRLGRVVAGIACLLLTVTPLLVASSQTALNGAARAFDRGDCATAIDGSLDSLGALSVRAEPFELLGYCDLRAGHPDLALRAFRAARERDPGNWRYAYGLAVAQALGGEDPRGSAVLAVRLNPREPLAGELARSLAGDRPVRWRRAAARAPLPF
jgi:O-Antigen ligase